jgi:hypothetical protein
MAEQQEQYVPAILGQRPWHPREHPEAFYNVCLRQSLRGQQRKCLIPEASLIIPEDLPRWTQGAKGKITDITGKKFLKTQYMQSPVQILVCTTTARKK